MRASSAARESVNLHCWARTACLAVAAALAAAASAVASPECPNGGNLIPNCGFEVNDTSFWDTSNNDSFGTSTSFAHTGTASAVGNANDTKSAAGVFMEACVENVEPSTSYEFGAWVRAASTNTSSGFDCIVSIFEAADSLEPCGGSPLGELNGSGGAPFDAFEEVRGQASYVTAAEASDIGIAITCSREVSDPDFDLYIDDFFFIPTLTIFKNGFESQDTCEWSASVGGGC